MNLDRTTTALLVGLHDPANAAAWEAFDRRYRPILIGFARNCGLRDHDAAEIAQTVVVKFLEQYRQGKYDRERGRLGNWLVMIARYAILDFRRSRTAQVTGRGDSAMIDLDDDASVTEAYETQRRLAILREALQELQEQTKTDPRTIRAFELLYYHGMTPKSVAADLGISVHDVYLAKGRVAARVKEIVSRIERDYEEAPGEWDASAVDGGTRARPSSLFGS